MKNPFFSLPDTNGELLDLRLALRLIVRQALKPMHGLNGTPTPRHTVTPFIKPAFIPALKATLRSNVRFIAQTASRIQRLFPSLVIPGSSQLTTRKNGIKTATTRTVTSKPVISKSIASKSVGNRPVAGKLSSPVSGKAPMGKSLHKGAAQKGKRVTTSDNSAASAPRIIHPTTTPPEKIRDGVWVEYNKHAVVIARGNYTNNLKTGMWREYYDTGELMIEENFTLGVQHGRFATYHPNGQCCSDGAYEQGRREGRFFMYDESGRHVRTLTFDRDTLVEDTVIEQRLAMA